MENKTNFKLEIQYDGTRYKGWQIQKGNVATIQEKIEKVLSKLTGEEIQVIGCGRTDSGVHAESYIANFTTRYKGMSEEVMEYLNEYLPEDIRIKKATKCSDRFHSRYNVVSKTYVYKIDTKEYADVFMRRYAAHVQGLNVEKMRAASTHLIGTHDFKSFTVLKKKDKSTVRTINYIKFSEENGILEIEFNGNGFLKKMVRLITGTLIEVGLGERKAGDIVRILEAKKREEAGMVALAHGLSMKCVEY